MGGLRGGDRRYDGTNVDQTGTLVPRASNDKPFGRLAAFTILIAHLGKGLSLEPRPLDAKIAELAAQLFDLP